jgi:hypothetical protein
MKTINKKDSLPIINGDLFEHIKHIIKAGNNGSTVIVPHVCNNIDAFGAGFASAVAKNYPIVKENYHLLGLSFLKNNLGYVQFVDVYKDSTYGHKLIFANMIAQNGLINTNNPRPLNYLALTKSMVSVAKYIQQNFSDDHENKVQIHAPKFGSGLAGGNWNFIQDLIKDIWTNIPTFIYSYK